LALEICVDERELVGALLRRRRLIMAAAGVFEVQGGLHKERCPFASFRGWKTGKSFPQSREDAKKEEKLLVGAERLLDCRRRLTAPK
jgi:hypothetical protein